MYTSKIFVTVDVVLIKETSPKQILLIKRKNDPFQNCWALPGGFVDENEDLVVAAKRELEEETQIKVSNLEQLKAYGKPFRDPRNHVVSIAYFGIANESTEAKASDDAEDCNWFEINDLPNLAFDHLDIVKDAIQKHNLL
jgi:8-oxo-dGTP diphosphatase